MDGLSEEESAVVTLVREFVDRDVRPAVRELEHANAYPDKLIGQMKELGIFGLAIPEPWGGAQVSAQCYAAVTEELARGWMSLAGAMGGHTVVAKLLVTYGTPEQRDRWLPKLGYKGVESCELSFADFRAPADAVLGGEPGHGFAQMMNGLEIGRIQVASRAVGVAQAAFDDALRYAQERESFGQPIWKHQQVGAYLADMATKLTASRQLVRFAAERYDAGDRCDLEAGMAKLFASEAAMEIALNAIRIHGGYGYSTEFDVERYFRDAPLMIVGEGTNEIQRNVIAQQLISRGGLGVNG
jgi:alkylation response protein AidB-like acyl-CoA dehydrogenase